MTDPTQTPAPASAVPQKSATKYTLTASVSLRNCLVTKEIEADSFEEASRKFESDLNDGMYGPEVMEAAQYNGDLQVDDVWEGE